LGTRKPLAAGCLLTLASVILMGLTLVLFVTAFNKPETNGPFAVAGAILVGAGLIAVAIATWRENGPPD
jgi:hypothetical protein